MEQWIAVRKANEMKIWKAALAVVLFLTTIQIPVEAASEPAQWKSLSSTVSSVQKHELANYLQPLAKSIPVQTVKYTCSDCKAVPASQAALEEMIRKNIYALNNQKVEPKQQLTIEQAAVSVARLISQLNRKAWPSENVQVNWKSNSWSASSIQLLRKHKISTGITDYRKPLTRSILKNWLQLIWNYQQLSSSSSATKSSAATPSPTPVVVPADEQKLDEEMPEFELLSVNPSEVIVVSKRFLTTLGPVPTGSASPPVTVTPSPTPAASESPTVSAAITPTVTPTATPKVYPLTISTDNNSDLSYSWYKDLTNPAQIRIVPKSTFAPGKYEFRWSAGSPSPAPVVFQIDKPYLKKISMERAEVVRGSESLIPLTFQDQYGQAVEVVSGDIGIALMHAVTGAAYKEKITYDSSEKRFRIDLSSTKVNDRFQMNVIHRNGLMAHGVITVVNPKNVQSVRIVPERTSVSGTILESVIAVQSTATDQTPIRYTKAVMTGDVTVSLQNPLDNQQLSLRLEGISKITGLIWSNGRMRVQYVVSSKADIIRMVGSIGTVQAVQTIYTMPATPQPSATTSPGTTNIPVTPVTVPAGSAVPAMTLAPSITPLPSPSAEATATPAAT